MNTLERIKDKIRDISILDEDDIEVIATELIDEHLACLIEKAEKDVGMVMDEEAILLWNIASWLKAQVNVTS